jgi:hypothetical protein
MIVSEKDKQSYLLENTVHNFVFKD